MSASSGNGADIDARASAWAIRSAERALGEQEQKELDSWLAADSRHLGAYVRAQALWLDLDRVAALDGGARRNPSPPARKRVWRRYAMAASLAVVVAGGAVAYDQLAGRVATGRSEVRRIALEDGSIVTLNGNSAVQIRYEDDIRRVVLRRGEASFEVAHNSERPFVVSADGVKVRAVGTEFVVGIEDDGVEVTVEEGVVAIAGRASGLAAPRYIRRNEQFVAAATGPRKAMLDSVDVERRIAWRKGLLVFNGQRLGDAAAEVNRYSDLRVTIDDPTLARAEFMGVFKLGDARAFANAAASAFNGEVHRRGNELVLVRQQNSPSH
ncbi:FecR domain-containing protein [Sphingopyxis panaciterrulae]|uniref:Transmembrane sensor n=1 Tax=Sphingopyxis panaciterrulae TaxID=462372 RepID=A0A7W9B863_9SPHN|nr:transmembrane sensor [Sphingopyxis panaciterrulae]